MARAAVAETTAPTPFLKPRLLQSNRPGLVKEKVGDNFVSGLFDFEDLPPLG
jgi:hypothetical protein